MKLLSLFISSSFQFSLRFALTCCSYPWPQPLALPIETLGFWLGINISGGCEALPISPERMPLSLCLAARRQQRRRGNSVHCCNVWLARMVISCVFLPNASYMLEKSKNPVRNLGRQILWNGRQVWCMYTCLNNTREALVLNLHMFSIVCCSYLGH
jgi:hypothetical protein